MSINNTTPGSLERYAQWLASIPREDEPALHLQPEWTVFVNAMERLEYAHQRVVSETYISTVHQREAVLSSKILNRDQQLKRTKSKSLLQHLSCDEVLIRILDFLPCSSLLNVSRTCHRLHTLAFVSAYRRTRNFSVNQFLNASSTSSTLELAPTYSDAWKHMTGTMKLLRAFEESVGILPNEKPFVRIPLMALPGRVLVSGAGDREFNGTYFCTGFNGNGFVFSKPRHQQDHVNMRSPSFSEEDIVEESDNEDEIDNYSTDILRCVIARKYSGDMLLWYMSKEVSRKYDRRTIGSVYIFWAHLMISNDPSDADDFRYPSQTSRLTSHGGNGWQSFNESIHPPIVELSFN